MPIYEYVCRTCKKRSSHLVLNYRQALVPPCNHCGSRDVDRILSRFAAPKSEEARLESLAESTDLDSLDEGNPESMARFMRKMRQEMGDDLGEGMDDMDTMLDNEEALHDAEDDLSQEDT